MASGGPSTPKPSTLPPAHSLVSSPSRKAAASTSANPISTTAVHDDISSPSSTIVTTRNAKITAEGNDNKWSFPQERHSTTNEDLWTRVISRRGEHLTDFTVQQLLDIVRRIRQQQQSLQVAVEKSRALELSKNGGSNESSLAASGVNSSDFRNSEPTTPGSSCNNTATSKTHHKNATCIPTTIAATRAVNDDVDQGKKLHCVSCIKSTLQQYYLHSINNDFDPRTRTFYLQFLKTIFDIIEKYHILNSASITSTTITDSTYSCIPLGQGLGSRSPPLSKSTNRREIFKNGVASNTVTSIVSDIGEATETGLAKEVSKAAIPQSSPLVQCEVSKSMGSSFSVAAKTTISSFSVSESKPTQNEKSSDTTMEVEHLRKLTSLRNKVTQTSQRDERSDAATTVVIQRPAMLSNCHNGELNIFNPASNTGVNSLSVRKATSTSIPKTHFATTNRDKANCGKNTNKVNNTNHCTKRMMETLTFNKDVASTMLSGTLASRPACQVTHKPSVTHLLTVRSSFDNRYHTWDPYWKCIYDVLDYNVCASKRTTSAVNGIGLAAATRHQNSFTDTNTNEINGSNVLSNSESYNTGLPPTTTTTTDAEKERQVLTTSKVISCMEIIETSKNRVRGSDSNIHQTVGKELNDAIKPASCLTMRFKIPHQIADECGEDGKKIQWRTPSRCSHTSCSSSSSPASPQHGERRLIVRMLPLVPPSRTHYRADTHLWPKGTFLEYNNTPIRLHQRRQQAHDLSLWKGMCYPLDLTSHVENCNGEVEHTLSLITQDDAIFGIQVCIAEYQSPQHLLSKVLEDTNALMSYDNTVREARQYLNAQTVVVDDDDENDAAAGSAILNGVSLSLELRCPISMTCITYPVRGRHCKHIQCFDLLTFIQSNAFPSGRRWKCPCCDTYVSLWDNDGIVICGLFRQMLHRYGNEIRDGGGGGHDVIEFGSDGSWKLASRTKQKRGPPEDFPIASNMKNGKRRKAEEVIVL